MKTITNTFIRIADDSPARQGMVPKLKADAEPSLARRHYDLLINHPYEYDINSFNFEIFCQKAHIDEADRDSHREAFFSKGHPCMRASPLTKTHGWGAHYNGSGKIAIYPVDSVAYRKLLNDPGNKVEIAMRSARPSPDASAQPAGRDPGAGPQKLHSAA
jgi:hypothetical protein